MGQKTLSKLLDGKVIFSDTRTIEEAQCEKLTQVRQLATFQISSAGLDAATQQNAALGIYEPERCEAIKNYISACRNEYLRCKGLILAATTNDEADAIKFNAPTTPEGL